MVTTTWTAWTATQTAELPTETQTQAAETTTVELPTETQSQTQTAEPTTTLSETLTTTRSATATRTRSQTRTTTTLRPNALIAGRVYIDSNSNGVWDDGELGLSNVTLSLTGTNSRGESVNLTTTTDPSGLYAFGDLRGTTSGYTITEVQPAGFANSPLGPATVIAVPTLGESQVLLNQDFGEVAVALSGIVFVDSPTGDGIYTEDKFPVPNVTVRIFETDGNGNKVGSALATTVTDEFGQYLFAPLDPGKQYLVERDVPAGYTVPPASGWYETRLENVTNSKFLWSGNDFPLTLLQPDVNPNPMGAIGGIVYVDWSQDGVYQEGETPISGTVIRLSGNTTEGVRVSRLAITRPNGTYRFLALRPGTYTVREYQPSGTFDSLGPGTLISNIIVVGGTLDLDYNFGELVTWTRTRTRTTTQSTTSRTTSTTTFARASITGRVYFDADDNGAFTNGEQPIRSVTIQATGTNLFGVAVSTQAVTDCTGAYAFANVDAGDYTITKINPSGFKNAQNSVLQSTTTVAVRGPNSVPFQWWGLTCDSDAISSGAATNLVVSGRTFVDISPTDDIFNPVTEVGISNVVFTLTGTDVNGAAVSRTMNSYSCSSGSCGSNTFCTNSLCLDLSCGSNRINVNGMYYFNGLKPGTYTVTQTQPFGYLNGNASASSTATVVSNIDLTAACIARNNFPELGHAGYWTSSTVTTTATRTATTSFTRSSTTSFTSTSSLTRTSSSRTATATPLQDGGVTGRVWFDKNENGLWDGDPLDIPIGGVGIAITGTNYLGEQQLFFVASDPQTGWYNFTMIPPGNYRVQQTQPLGWVTAPGAVDFYNITITSGLYLSELDFLEVPEEPENANP
ncbi:hypothetical protein DFJ74DRAFT_655748 [Hyaloraphidium curvatum]|nr:hypothetical protein DFJ74DRAFT_655748 [Hyaloraphidium curvatum]